MISFDFVISIKKLIESHVALYGKSSTYKYDFVFINILMGNDYIPKLGIVQLKHLWNAYVKLLHAHSNWLIKINDDNKVISFNAEFFHDIIICALLNSRKKPVPVTISDINSVLYTNYIYGMAWCMDMYNSGTCYDWTYMAKSITTINPLGVVYSLLLKDKYQIILHKSIDKILYNALAMPYASNNISNSSKLIQDKINLKYPHFYDNRNDDRCIDTIIDIISNQQ